MSVMRTRPLAKRTKVIAEVVAGTVMAAISITVPASAQSVVVVQSIQTSPLEIVAPYNMFSSAQPAVVTLRINEPATLSVSSPLPQGFSDPPGTNYSSTLYYNGSEAAAGSSLNINTLGNVDVEIDMRVTRPQAYSVDSYTYGVLLTVVAQ